MYVILIISVYASFQFQFNIPIRPEAWARIKNSHRDSLFVKELAVAMWGTKTLGERSLTGKECPTTKTSRQPLTPEKLTTLKGISLFATLTPSLRNTCFTCFVRMHGFHCGTRVSHVFMAARGPF